MTATSDVIDTLVGIAPGSRLDAVRAARQQARDNAQASYLALFEPSDVSQVSLPERFAVAVFVAGLHGQASERSFYEASLKAVPGGTALVGAVSAAIAAGRASGPKGAYPKGPLSIEDTPAPVYTPDAAALGSRLAAAFAHAHMLVFHPRDAAPEYLKALIAAGWSTTGIVTLSQLVAFLAFQLRVIKGLKALAAAPVAAAVA